MKKPAKEKKPRRLRLSVNQFALWCSKGGKSLARREALEARTRAKAWTLCNRAKRFVQITDPWGNVLQTVGRVGGF